MIFSLIYTDTNSGVCVKYILGAWDNYERNLKLLQAKFIDMIRQVDVPRLNILTLWVRQGFNSLADWLP